MQTLPAVWLSGLLCISTIMTSSGVGTDGKVSLIYLYMTPPGTALMHATPVSEPSHLKSHEVSADQPKAVEGICSIRDAWVAVSSLSYAAEHKHSSGVLLLGSGLLPAVLPHACGGRLLSRVQANV